MAIPISKSLYAGKVGWQLDLLTTRFKQECTASSEPPNKHTQFEYDIVPRRMFLLTPNRREIVRLGNSDCKVRVVEHLFETLDVVVRDPEYAVSPHRYDEAIMGKVVLYNLRNREGFDRGHDEDANGLPCGVHQSIALD